MLIGFLTFIFLMISFFLAVIVLLQHGKGDMGLGSIAAGSQALFGGSGGQEFFERLTWFLGLAFIGTSLLLSIMRSGNVATTSLANYKASVRRERPLTPAPTKQQQAPDVAVEEETEEDSAQS